MKPEEVRDLLPWYATGSLDPEQARMVEAALRDEPQLDRELAEWRALHAVVAEVGAEEPAFRPELIEDAHRRIDAYEQARAGMSRAGAAKRRAQRASARTDGTTWLERILGVWNATPMAARVMVAAQFAALAVLVGVLGVWHETGFTTASGGSGQATAGRRVTVVFQPERPFREIQALLDETGAQIVAGPSGQGAYVLDLGKVDAAQAGVVLETLRKDATLVRYAAPLE